MYFEEPKTKGVTRNTINEFVNNFRESLEQDQKEGLGAPQIRGFKSYKFQVNVKPGYAWELKELWTEFVNNHEVKLSGTIPYFIFQRPPEAQKVFDKMGATYSKLQKIFQAPVEVIPDWRSKAFAIKMGPMEEEKHVLTIREDLGLDWDEEGVRATGKSSEELALALA